MNRADLDLELARLRGLVERCATEEEASALLHSMADDVPMLRGEVIPASLWEKVRPAFDDLRKSLYAILERAKNDREADLLARHTTTLRLCYPAELHDRNEQGPVTDAALMARCAGASEHTHLERYGLPAPVLALQIHATVEHRVHGLEVVVAVALEREPTDSELSAIIGRIERLLDTGWGNNYDFPIPAALRERYVVFFSTEPVRSELVARPRRAH